MNLCYKMSVNLDNSCAVMWRRFRFRQVPFIWISSSGAVNYFMEPDTEPRIYNKILLLVPSLYPLPTFQKPKFNLNIIFSDFSLQVVGHLFLFYFDFGSSAGSDAVIKNLWRHITPCARDSFS